LIFFNAIESLIRQMQMGFFISRITDHLFTSGNPLVGMKLAHL